MKPLVTYIFVPICDVFIARALYTLHKYSEPGTFKVVLIDQTKNRLRPEVYDYVKDKIDLYIHPPKRQLGYAKAMNEGMLHALHWGSKYICPANDDIEIINSDWLQGVLDTFSKDERIVGVVPMSPRVAGWGYGVSGYPEVLPYKKEYTQQDYDYLLKGDFSDKESILPKTMPKQIGGTIVDGAVFVMPYFKREALMDIGLMDERFFPGSGEDMDWMARAYIKNKRVVSTSLSWVWHWWSKSKDLFASGELEDPYYKPPTHPYWNNMGEIWPEGHDPWGKKDGKILPRVSEIFVDQI